MVVVNNAVREHADEISFTAPVFYIEGKLYKNAAAGRDEAAGVVLAGRMTGRQLEKIKYEGEKIAWHYADSTKELLEYAASEGTGFILGDEGELSEADAIISDYMGIEENVYHYNVCIVTDVNDSILCSAVNKCIHGIDKAETLYYINQRWGDGDDLKYRDNNYKDIYILFIIMFFAVLITFFIYYQANKNLYSELEARMSELTNSKNELKATFNGVSLYMAELRLEGLVLNVNKAFTQFVDKNFLNVKIWDVLELSPKESLMMEAQIKDVGQTGAAKTMEIKQQGRLICVDFYPIENAGGIIDKVLFMGTDVTNERIAEQQLLQDNKMIAVGQLASGVAHEIRNPLGIIRNYCYVLRTAEDKTVLKKSVEQIEKAVESSGHIIDSLLNFSRPSQSFRRQINLEEHVDSLMLLNQGMWKKKDIIFEMHCKEEIIAYLPVESLNMILINLISNAIEAMDAKGRLTVTLVKEKESFDVVVEDTGKGIEEEILDEIFNPFFTTRKAVGGNGLGLYVVYNEVNKMNGQIRVESTVGKGTEFTVTLPMERMMP